MASISIDVASILGEIRLYLTQIKDEQVALREKTKAAQLLVYRALSLHPALDHMRPPTGMLADVDWYTELRSPFTSGIFRKLGMYWIFILEHPELIVAEQVKTNTSKEPRCSEKQGQGRG